MISPEGQSSTAEGQTAQTPVARSEEEGTLPPFTKGETGPHTPTLTQKETTPPKPFTEATLLRAMETAGRNVDDEELREAMKENGIGRPSTRAAIIQTLYKRGYIRQQRKSLEATPTGIALIGLIQEELLKSAELTGIWENKLRQIERRTYSAQQFVAELKQMVSELVHTVLCDNTNRRLQQAPLPRKILPPKKLPLKMLPLLENPLQNKAYLLKKVPHLLPKMPHLLPKKAMAR